MSEKELIATVTIDNYVREIVLSNKVRVKYYKKKSNKELLVKYCKKEVYKETKVKELDETKYKWLKIGKDKEFYLYNIKTMEKEISNSNRAGKVSTKIINGQDLHRLTLPEYTASKIKKAIKEQFIKYVSNLDIINVQPIIVDCELRDTFRDYLQSSNPEWDLDNRLLFYKKVFNDVLSGTPSYTENGMVKTSKEIIKKDHRGFITGGSHIFTPINKQETRQLIFRIYHDKRESVKNFGVLSGVVSDLEDIIIKKQPKQKSLFLI